MTLALLAEEVAMFFRCSTAYILVSLFEGV